MKTPLVRRVDAIFTTFAGWVSERSGQPAVFVIALATVIVWAVSGPAFGFSETWQLVINTGTTIVTFLMVFLIQNAQNRDTASVQAKLDELLRATEGAREEFIGIEHLDIREIESIRLKLEKEICTSKGLKPNESVAKLIKRL